MASISKIRYTNIIYENGNKRYNDEIFQCAGHNTAILLENGGGKTVFIQAALQAVLPHSDLGDRRVKETFLLENEAAHIAIEWIINDKPRRYALTAVTLYLQNNELKSYKYVCEYGIDYKNDIESIPFTKVEPSGRMRASSKGEMHDYYLKMAKEYMTAAYFETNKDFHAYIEENFKIVASEWRNIARINGQEGGVDDFFEGCKTTNDLVEKLLLPTVEQGLVGGGSDEFAATFESKREHFKKYKQLENTIKESQKIKEEVTEYVQRYKDYHEKTVDYEKQKQEAKALWNIILDKEEEVQEQKLHLQLDIEKAEEEASALEEKEKLIEVTLAKEAFEEAKIVYEAKDNFYQREKMLRRSKIKRRHLLKLSQFGHEMELAEAQIRINNQLLDELDKDTEIEELKEALVENESFLKGYYEEQLESLQIQKRQLSNEQEYDRGVQRLKQQEIEKIREKSSQYERDMSKLSGHIENNQKAMERIKKEVLAHCEHEEISKQSKSWQNRIADIEAHELEVRQKLKELQDEESELKLKLEQKQTIQIEYTGKMNQLLTKIRQLEETQEEVLLEVKNVIPSFYSLSSLYAKPQQIEDSLEEQVEKLNREKENALICERQSSYFIEKYKGHTYFTAEPFLEEWVSKWKLEFSFLQTGTEFVTEIEKASVDKNSLAKWTQIIVVADGQEERIITKIKDQKSKLVNPIGIVKLSDAKRMLEEGLDESKMIYPLTWEENLECHDFEEHKKIADRALEEAINLRKQKEEQLKKMERILDKIRNFFNQYPFEIYSQWQQTYNELKTQEAQAVRMIKQYHCRQQEIDQEKDNLIQIVEQENAEKSHLIGYVEKAKHYLELEQENKVYGNEYYTLNVQQAEEKHLLDQAEKALEMIIEHLETLKDELNRVERKQFSILDDPLYGEVKYCDKVYSKETFEYLKERHGEIKSILENKQKGRSEIESALKNAKESFKRNQDYYSQEEKEMNDVGVEIPSYMEEYKVEIEQLTDQVNKLNEELKELEGEMYKAKTGFDKKEQDFQSKKENFERAFKSITTYIKNCAESQRQLEEERKRLKEKKTYLQNQKQRREKELSNILTQKQIMDKKDQLYGYCAPDVQAGRLEGIEVQAISYNLDNIVKIVIDKLEQCRDLLESSGELVKSNKENFQIFCQQQIKNSKLKNMAIQGILQKAEYEELLKWEKNIINQINQTIQITRQDLIEQDKEDAQFIIHLYKYLCTVAKELKEIPKKTRVKTVDGDKDIYDFDVPSWQEDESKEKLRNYMYNLLEEIDKQGFKNAEGVEDTPRLRKYIKEQFKVKQLLKLVLDNNAIRVKCRKVSNINSISGQKFSWETSTKWSGGERWSKNMALYLGILNYLAEKKQNIYSTTQKISRVVILDNPFGKASSGHVLEPVFYIAKQLGFQIIALTAHSEGDFIRKYFPIVYSCKLRQTADQTTNILSKEQEIKKAYFMDNDPIAFSMLGSKVQLDLFEN